MRIRHLQNFGHKRSCQYQKNSDYNARLEAIDNAKREPQEMYDRTNDMLPIGGYLNITAEDSKDQIYSTHTLRTISMEDS